MSQATHQSEEFTAPRRITIPYLLDILLVSDPAQIAYLDGHPAIERSIDGKASWLHRMLAGRFQHDLAFDGVALPVFRSRKDRERAAQQRLLSDRLDRIRGLPGVERDEIGRYVSGESPTAPIAELVQTWCGRLFRTDYQTDGRGASAGRRIASFPSALPWVTLFGKLTGRHERDKKVLAERAAGDLNCVHATSIGAENLRRTLKKMRAAAKDPALRLASPDEIMRACLVVPKALVRAVTSELHAPFLDRPLTSKSLVIFRVARAYESSGDLDVAFAGGSWSACPARGAVAECLRAVWHAAHHDERDEPRKDRDLTSWSRLVARALS